LRRPSQDAFRVLPALREPDDIYVHLPPSLHNFVYLTDFPPSFVHFGQGLQFFECRQVVLPQRGDVQFLFHFVNPGSQ